ncbi:hypothetical protein [Winogradskyella poriferorum]|uniref:Uncharacterized protein n=1 Tax=Winogradskyella poriferorum TaxID=307627 RepID=A0ABU7W377_9FLAO
MKLSLLIIVSLVSLLTVTNEQKTIKTTTENAKQVDCDLLPSVRSNHPVNFHINEIDSSKYNPRAFQDPYKLTIFANSDSIEKIYQEDYPEIFKKTDKGYKFKNSQGQEIIAENNLEQEKLYSKYEFKAGFENYVMILLTYFEGSQVVIIDLETGLAFTTLDKPRFITETKLYSFADYYGDSDIHFYNIETKESVHFSFQNLSIVDSYNVSNHVFFKAICMTTMEEKYFEILN